MSMMRRMLHLACAVLLIALAARSCDRGEWHKILPTIILYVGVAMNGAAIVFNGGKMPVKLPPGEDMGDCSDRHVTMNNATRLKWLCDVVRFRSIYFSIGDVFLALSICVNLMVPLVRL